MTVGARFAAVARRADFGNPALSASVVKKVATGKTTRIRRDTTTCLLLKDTKRARVQGTRPLRSAQEKTKKSRTFPFKDNWDDGGGGGVWGEEEGGDSEGVGAHLKGVCVLVDTDPYNIPSGRLLALTSASGVRVPRRGKGAGSHIAGSTRVQTLSTERSPNPYRRFNRTLPCTW